jgi:hypothetical protein
MPKTRDGFYLCFAGPYPEFERHASKKDACAAFLEVARDLDRFGQEITATLHIASNRSEIAECPDFVLSLGPRGGLKIEGA